MEKQKIVFIKTILELLKIMEAAKSINIYFIIIIIIIILQ